MQLLAEGAELGVSRSTLAVLRETMRSGDELWTHTSPDVVRRGEVVRDVLTVMN